MTHAAEEIYQVNADNDSENQSSDKKSRSTHAVVTVVVAVITTIGGVTTAIIANSKDSTGNSGSATSAVVTLPVTSLPSSTLPAPPAESVAITSPKPGQSVVGRQGVQLTGTAQNLDGKLLRIFDLADDHKYYLITGVPVPVANGQWSFFDPQVGSTTPDDDGHAFTLTVTMADASCNGTLDTATPNGEGDIVYQILPAGCRKLASVEIVKRS
ncbi:hypothetical protein [Amycolatopsis vastitatis]|uniref:hypothetical protein n=1 Tax=Amycolatopsis vastitatis TaxID=1905142 RepID=UPI0011773C4D|nr:hypothetical protein [Amycolatopsis vastitatis]